MKKEMRKTFKNRLRKSLYKS